MKKSPETLEQAQKLLAERLHKLKPTGELGFEDLLADALSEFTGQPFYVAKSGHQEGSDVRSAPYNLFRIGLEAKRYQPSSSLPLDALLHKITDAAAARQPVDLWILAATRSINVSDREHLHFHGEQCGIGVVVLDWPEKPTRLCELAVICGAAVHACEKFLQPTTQLIAALNLIRSDNEFEQIHSQLLKRFTQADIGYANAQLTSERWLVEAQDSLANAKSRLGGHHNLRESEYGIVSRTAINARLDDWYASSHGVAALLGDEGTGKSWAALDWHDRLKSSANPAPLTIFLPASAISTSNDVMSSIAGAIAKQTGIQSSSFWERRLKLWESSQGNGVRILIIIDGLNENFHFVNWADWLQPLFEDRLVCMYHIIVSCWPDWWRTSLAELMNLVPQPQEILVERFGDGELDSLLTAMNLTRSDFAPAVLELIRVPRLSSLVMTHRDKLKDSGDVTAERVIYEDWKDRLQRRGPKVGLTDQEMKAFVAELGEKLQLDLDQAMTRGDVVKSLSEESGKTGPVLQSAVAELASGRWLQPGKKPNTFKVVRDRIPFVLAVTLMSKFRAEEDAVVLEAKIAEFLDPLKAHSLGARILRAATTIALIETQASAVFRRVVMSRWLEEQNFNVGDFDTFWRLIGIQPELVFDLAESWWHARRGRSFTDEVFIKAIANAAEFTEFRAALEVRLIKWLGTAWPDPKVGEFLGKVDPTTIESQRRVDNTRSRYMQWAGSQSAKAFVCVRLDESACDWSWLSHRALALSYLDRAPFVTALEAWALSRAVMDRPRHEDELGWVLRLNLNDDSETTEAVLDLVQRLKGHDPLICRQAIKYLEIAMSHVQRADLPLELHEDLDDHAASALQVAAMSAGDLLDATQKYLLPYAWKKHDPEAAAELINALILRGFDEEDTAFDLILDHIHDLLTVLTPDSRKDVCEAISTKLEECEDDSETGKQRKHRLRSALLVLKLYDAEPREQSRLVLTAGIGVELDAWLPYLRSISLADIGEPDFDGIADNDLAGWLDYITERLPLKQMDKLEFLPNVIVHNNHGVRKGALSLAIHGQHFEALEAFSTSSYSKPTTGDDKPDREYEYLRNRALLELHKFAPPQEVSDILGREYIALIAKFKSTDAEAFGRFNEYLYQQFSAIKSAISWSSPNYWQSYRKEVTALVEHDLNSVLHWLLPWIEEPGEHVDRALMDRFPVMDVMQALGTVAPEVSIKLYMLLVERTRGGFISSAGLRSFPFSLSESPASNELCSQQLTDATNDKSLLEIVYFSHKHDRLDWLFGWIEKLETSETPINVGRAYTLLAFCDRSARADTLWECFLGKPPTDFWLESILKSSVADYRANQIARTAFAEIWASDKPSVARHSMKRVLETCDMRILLWIDKIQPKWEDCAYDRRLVKDLSTSQLNEATRGNRDKRKKEFVQTPLAYSIMSPWK